jgi:hypothetical protein
MVTVFTPHQKRLLPGSIMLVKGNDHRMNKWTPVDVVAALIAITVCSFALLAMLGPVFTGRALTVEKAEMLKIIVLTLIALLSVYIGKKL